MIKLNHIHFSYPRKKVIEDFNLSFQSDRINCLLGPSGCGKTTILNLLSGINHPQSGEITGLPEAISYIFQDTRIMPWKTVYENVIFPLKGRLSADQIGQNAERFLTHLGLWEQKDAYPVELSGGMRQRVSIARAFAYPSRLILMDEAFQGLDIVLKERVLNDFSKSWMDDPRTVVFVSHDLDEALTLGQQIIVLPNSPITKGTIIEIDHPPGLERRAYPELKEEIKVLLAQ